MRDSRCWILVSAAIFSLCFAHNSHGLGLFDDTAGDELPEITFEVIPSHTELRPGDEGVIAVALDIPYNYHVQDDLDVEFEGAEGFETGEIVKPEGTFDETVKAIFFYGKPHFAFPFKISNNSEKTERNITAKIHYSPCSEALCFGRFEKDVSFTIAVGDKRTDNPAFIAIEKDVPSVEKDKSGEAEKSEVEPIAGLEGKIRGALAEGSWVVFLLVFVGGIATSFTPCVFPMIPITVSYFGSRAAANIGRGFLGSLMYVLGIVITYSIMGVIAGATGAAFGSFAEHPAVIIVIVAIFLLLAASMFGAFELHLPEGLSSKVSAGATKGGVFGPLFLGLVLGFIAAPCVGPVIIAMLTYIARKQSIIYGFWLMFFFALGMGMLFIVIGTFSGAINRLPKSGFWMVTVKKTFGSLMIAMAIYFARPLLPPGAYGYVVGVALIVFGVFAGAFTRPCEKPSVWDNIKKVVAVIAVVVGIFGIVVSMIGSGLFMSPGLRFGPSRGEMTGLEIDWVHSFERAAEKAKAENKLMMVDFYAENCPACIEMDRFTYSNAEVVEDSRGFVAAKLYANDNKSIVRKYGILGYPAAVFLKPDGTQIGETAYGYIEADKFLRLMDEAAGRY